MIKQAKDLVPGDVINLGDGSKLIVAIQNTGEAISVLLESGDTETLRYDCKLYIFYNADEQQEMRQEQLRRERNQRIAEQEKRNREFLQCARWNSVVNAPHL